MTSYLMDVMCASGEYPSLGWKWNPSLSSIHVYCKMIWENKYKEDYERICNGLFAPIYQILFGKEAPRLSLEGQEIVKKYGDQCMTPDGVYIRMIGGTKSPHWLPHFIPDKLLLQDMGYQTCINGIFASLLKAKKDPWPPFPFYIGMCRIENIKQEKDKVNVLSSFKFREVNF